MAKKEKLPDVTIKAGLINAELPDSIDTAAKNLTNKPTKEIGQAIADIFSLVFRPLHERASKSRIKYELELEAFEKELKTKIQEIPEERIIEPDICTVAPILEKAKYSIELKNLREMFSELVAKSMDTMYQELVHPYYAHVLSQLGVLEIELILHMLKNGSKLNIIVIKDISYKDWANRREPFQNLSSNVYLTVQTSIHCLLALGLIKHLNADEKTFPAKFTTSDVQLTLAATLDAYEREDFLDAFYNFDWRSYSESDESVPPELDCCGFFDVDKYSFTELGVSLLSTCTQYEDIRSLGLGLF